MKDTKIEWADDTVNPWWGCERVSPACAHCYAETLAARFHPGLWGPGSDRRLRLDRAIGELESIARRGEREGRLRRVFIASMSDVFEDRADLIEPRKRLWDVLHRLAGESPRLIPMLLTKRPAVMAAWAKDHGWPAGAWAGTTVEDQRRADERIPELLRVPARVRFLSCEPLLGDVDLSRAIGATHMDRTQDGAPCDQTCPRCYGAQVRWIIVGGESGQKARPMHPAWARSLRDQAVAAGVAFHFKQWGEWGPNHKDVRLRRNSWDQVAILPDDLMCKVGKHAAGRLLDGRTWDEVPD